MKNENNKRNNVAWKITGTAAILAVVLLICCFCSCNGEKQKGMLNGWKWDFDWIIDEIEENDKKEEAENKQEEAENKQEEAENKQDRQETDTDNEDSEEPETNNQSNKDSGNLQQPVGQVPGNQKPEVPKDGDEEIQSPITPLDIIVELPKNRVYDKNEKPVIAYFVKGVTGTIDIKYYRKGYGVGLMNNKPIDKGTYYVVVTAEGNGKFCGKATVTIILKILPRPLTKADVIINPPKNLVYDAEETKEAEVKLRKGVTGKILSVKYIGDKLDENGKPRDKGTYYVVVRAKGTGNYDGEVTVTVEYTITPKSITASDVIINPPKNLVYDAEETKEAEVKLRKGVTGKILSVKYIGDKLDENGKPRDKGTYYVVVRAKGTGNYDGEVTVTVEYTITPKSITASDVIINPPKNLVYDTKNKELEVKLREGVTGQILSGKYTGENLVNEKPVNAGFYIGSFTVEGSGNYTGKVTVTFEFSIKKAKIDESNIVFSDQTFVYNASRSYSLKVEGSPVPVWYENNEQTEVGEHEVTAYFVVDSNHEPIAPRKAILTIKSSTGGNPGEEKPIPPTDEDTSKPVNPDEGEQVPPVEEDKKDPEEGEQPPAVGEEEKDPIEGEQPPAVGEEEKDPIEGEQPPAVGEEEEDPMEGEQLPAVGEEEPVEGEQTPPQVSDDVIEEDIQKNPLEEVNEDITLLPLSIKSIQAAIATIIVNNINHFYA